MAKKHDREEWEVVLSFIGGIVLIILILYLLDMV